MHTPSQCSAQVLSAVDPPSALAGSDSYQVMTIAAILLVLASIWVF